MVFKKKNIYLYSFLFFLSYFFVRHFVQYENFVGNLPRFSGLFITLSLLFFFLILSLSLSDLTKITINTFTAITLFLLINFLLVILIDYKYIGTDAWLFDENKIIVLYYLMFFVAGRYFFNIQQFYKIILVAFFVLAIEKILYLDIHTMHILLTVPGETTKTTLYLFLGDSFALISILLIILTKNEKYKILLVLFSVFILSILFTRTALYVFVIVIGLYMFKELRVSYKIMIGMIVSIFAIILISSFSFQELASHRMLSFLITGSDGSWESRNILTLEGIEAIKNNYIFGDYGGQYYKHHQLGAYMHNILSYYRQFGIFSLIFLSILLVKIGHYYYLWYKKAFQPQIDYVFYLSLFILIEAMFLRAYANPNIWFVFGLFSSIELFRRTKNENNTLLDS